MSTVVTIIRPDNSIVVDGVGRSVDCSSLPGYVKAIQWTGESGWIEFVQDGLGKFLPNLPINDLAPYIYLVEKWTEAGVAAEVAQKAVAKAESDAARVRAAQAAEIEKANAGAIAASRAAAGALAKQAKRPAK